MSNPNSPLGPQQPAWGPHYGSPSGHPGPGQPPLYGQPHAYGQPPTPPQTYTNYPQPPPANFGQPPGYQQPPMGPYGPVQPAVFVVPVEKKSVGVAFVLTFFFGPLGMLYSTVAGALAMIGISVVSAVFTGGLSIFVTWIVSIIWGCIAASNSGNVAVGPTYWR